MNVLKQKIINMLEVGTLAEQMEKLLEEYEAQYPRDLDLYGMKADYQCLKGNPKAAYDILKKAVRLNPYHVDTNVRFRDICERTGNYAEALKYDYILELIQDFFHIHPKTERHSDDLKEKLSQLGEDIISSGSLIALKKYQEDIDHILQFSDQFFGFMDWVYMDPGYEFKDHYYENMNGDRKYNAFYSNVDVEKGGLNAIIAKIEALKVFETKELQVGDACEYLLPVLTSDSDIEYEFQTSGEESFKCKSKIANHFNYFRIPAKTKITSDQILHIGNPIKLEQDPKKKKLVLNIFLDGFSQKILDEENFAEIMPFTSAFFSKGMKCTNVYSAAEWTLPSIASYVTGVSTVNHMVIHDKIIGQLPGDITLLQEYFQEQGYQTAKIDGDWRSTPSYGYGRGIDRMIYQHQWYGMRAEQVISDVLDHMQLMEETNQFIWMCVGDLHDTADGYELKAHVQSKIPIANRTIEDQGATSVKQDYSENKRMDYIQQMKYVDRCLYVLYQYIEEHYRDEEILVSIFGDHGQGYLIKPEEHFLGDGRSKVGMMFRGGVPAGSTCKELISTKDYICIMCKLAGIPMKEEAIEGRLPVCFGGEKEREYAICESIHTGDPYQASVHSKEHCFYFTSEGLTGYDGRVELGESRYYLLDSNGKLCRDGEKERQHLEALLEHIGSLIIC